MSYCTGKHIEKSRGKTINNIYKAKLEELKKAYKQASRLTDQIFYLPTLRDDNWRIFRYMGGDEKQLSKDEFVDFCKQNKSENMV